MRWLPDTRTDAATEAERKEETAAAAPEAGGLVRLPAYDPTLMWNRSIRSKHAAAAAASFAATMMDGACLAEMRGNGGSDGSGGDSGGGEACAGNVSYEVTPAEREEASQLLRWLLRERLLLRAHDALETLSDEQGKEPDGSGCGGVDDPQVHCMVHNVVPSAIHRALHGALCRSIICLWPHAL